MLENERSDESTAHNDLSLSAEETTIHVKMTTDHSDLFDPSDRCGMCTTVCTIAATVGSLPIAALSTFLILGPVERHH